MIPPVMCSVLACSALSAPLASSPAVVSASEDPALDAKITAAGTDVAKLIELATACTSAGQEDSAKRVWKKVLELDAGNEAAHKGLHHQAYAGKWFESFTELSKFKREEAARMKQKGLTRFDDQWVPEADLPFLVMHWTKDEKGAWSDPVIAAKKQSDAQKQKDGLRFRADDNSWIAPDDVAKWTALQWKCGDAWVDMEKANAYHASVEHAWELADEHWLVTSTCDWDGGNLARWHAQKVWPELVRLFGVQPQSQLDLVVLNSLEQYNQASGNTPTFPEAEGFSSLHGAYFSDVLFDTEAKPPRFQGCGVSYWDRKDEKGKTWGPLWVRWAAAQSFVDAIDRSWTSVSDWITNEGKLDPQVFATSFWAEKKIPRWIRYGAASYVERYMKDPLAAQGADPWTLRAFAFAELAKGGKLHKLDEVFAFKLDLKDVPNSTRLYDEAGLLVAYVLDGAPGDKELAKALEGFQAALVAGPKAGVTAAAIALQKTLAKHERDIKKFAGM
jgi:hypothetical protein